MNYGYAQNYFGEIEALRLDIYRPIPEEDELIKKPLILFIHGGGLTGGSSNTLYARYLGEEFSKRGFVYASINYRLGWNDLSNCLGDTLSLQFAFYRAIQDARAAIRFLKHNNNEFGIDTNFIFLSGFSVGSSIAVNTAYAKQEDYYSYLYDELGSIDSSGNSLYNYKIDIKGIIGKSTGIDTTLILENANIPAILFHGTCDSVVFYNEGPLYNCTTPVQYMFFQGSRAIADVMKDKNILYQLYTNEGLAHDAAGDDTIMLYSSEFLKDILCNELQSTEFYRFVNAECLPLQNNIFNIRPNPFHDYIQIDILTNESVLMDIDIYNAIGQHVMSRTYAVASPNSNLMIDVSNIPLSPGYYILRTQLKNTIYSYSLIKD